MVKYLLGRIGISAAAFFMLVTVTFFLTRMMPGSPFQTGAVSTQVVAALEAQYGLSEPVMQQYFTYLGKLLQGDFGISFQNPGVSVVSVIARAWPLTASLGLPAAVTAVLLGTCLGIGQAVSDNPAVKGSIFIGTVLGMAIPNFAAALLLLLIFGQTLKLVPVAGLSSPAHYILPVLSLAGYPTAVVSRLMHNAFAAEMEKEYAVMAKAKGLSKKRSIFDHILRNAWMPVLQYMGSAAAFLLTGSFAVETIFTIPGLGREFVLAISSRDYTLIMGLTIFMGLAVILIQLLTDLLGVLASPQIRRNGRA